MAKRFSCFYCGFSKRFSSRLLFHLKFRFEISVSWPIFIISRTRNVNALLPFAMWTIQTAVWTLASKSTTHLEKSCGKLELINIDAV